MRPSVWIFERPVATNRVHPCTVEDIRRTLEFVPEQDLVGLRAVGLVPTKRENRAIAE